MVGGKDGCGFKEFGKRTQLSICFIFFFSSVYLGGVVADKGAWTTP